MTKAGQVRSALASSEWREDFDAAVVGLGFVGLSTAVSFAKSGMRVAGVDVDDKKVAMISKGVVPFHEPQVEELLAESEGRLEVSSDLRIAGEAGIIFITVGTPSREDGSLDTRFLVSAARAVGSAIRGKGRRLVVLKSTATPGSLMDLVVPTIESASGMAYGRDFGACSNPEFLREGSAIQDTLHPDRLVIGGRMEDAEVLKRFYERVYGEGLPRVILTTPANAELTKYSSNAFLAMKISFANQIARICEGLPGADVKVVAEGMGLDARIGPSFLGAGLGFGGSCFPKDVKALLHFSRERGYNPPLVEATMEVNDDQPLRVVRTAEEVLGGLEGKKVSLLGLAFKPNTDDMREAVSVKIARELVRLGAKVSAHDPKALKSASQVIDGRVELVDDLDRCLRGSDCAVLVTEWEEYGALEPARFIALMRRPFLVDGRRLFDPGVFSGQLEYRAVGLESGGVGGVAGA